MVGTSFFYLYIIQDGGNFRLFETVRWYDVDTGFTDPNTEPPNLTTEGITYMLAVMYNAKKDRYYVNLATRE